MQEAKASAEAVAQILWCIQELCLPVPSVTMELLLQLLQQLFVLVEPWWLKYVLRFLAQQQQCRFK
jgi:hypothetical protein